MIILAKSVRKSFSPPPLLTRPTSLPYFNLHFIIYWIPLPPAGGKQKKDSNYPSPRMEETIHLC